MNCWRTTWGATLTNVGNGLKMFALGDATGISPIHTALNKHELGWLLVIGWIMGTVGTQWQGMAAADQKEVKRQLGLKADGFPLENESQKTTDDRARLGLGKSEDS